MNAEFYSGLAHELLAKLRRLSAFTGHAASIGATHEEFVKEAIRPLLSRRFSLRTGFAFAGEGVVSPQGDILIVDEHDPSPYLFQLGDLVVVHPRALALVIEVKTSLDRPRFHESLRRLRQFREVAEAATPRSVFLTNVFAFEGPALTPDTLHAWYESADVPDDVRSYPQMIFVLNQGALDLQRVSGSTFGHRLLMGEESDNPKFRSLSIFLAGVRKALERKAGLEANPYEQAHFDGLRWSAQYLQIGVGFVEQEGQRPRPGQP